MKIKTQEEIQVLKEGGQILGTILKELVAMVRPGISAFELNQHAEHLADKNGARCAFKGYTTGGLSPFPSGLCVSINEEVVHGMGNRNIELKEGDLVGLDMGIEYKGLFTDHAITVPVGKISKESQKLLEVTKESLRLGITEMKPGVSLNQVGKVIQEYAEQFDFGVVRELVGHGVGHAVHEAPEVPNFYAPNIFPNVILKPGMVLAVEPMLTMGTWKIDVLEDGWTIVTSDKSLSAHFEHTVAITENGHEILTLVK